MSLAPIAQSPRHALLPMEDGPAQRSERLFDEAGEEDEDGVYRLTNQHHIIGDSDDEMEPRVDSSVDRRDRRPVIAEHRKLLVSDHR